MGRYLPDRGSSHLGTSTWPGGAVGRWGWRRIEGQPWGCLLCPAPRSDRRVTGPSLTGGQAGETNMSDVEQPWRSIPLTACQTRRTLSHPHGEPSLEAQLWGSSVLTSDGDSGPLMSPQQAGRDGSGHPASALESGWQEGMLRPEASW